MQNCRKAVALGRYVVGLAVICSLAACSSAGNLRNDAPTAAYMGIRSVSDVFSWVSSAWATKRFKVSNVPLVSGTSLQLQETDGSPILALVDITPVGDHTTAKYYSRMPDDDTWFLSR